MSIIEMTSNKDKTEYYMDKYKVLSIYKKLKIIDDNLKKKLEDVYNDNVWDLKKLFKNLNELNDQMDNSGENPWDNGIQFLDYKPKPRRINKVSLNDFMKGEYRAKFVNKKPNAIKTEEKYAKRIKFYTKTFEPFQKYQDTDELKWIVKDNRRLLYEIMKYNNKNNNTLSSLNIDLKTMVRAIKLLLGDKDELKYKYSALQTSITDIENMGDDFNKIASQQEENQFVLYEHLLDIIDILEQKYITAYNQLNPRTRNNPLKHPNDLFNIHQDMIALAIYVWDFPSRFEKYGMEYIKDIKEVETGKNYILLPKGNEPVKLIFNEIKKDHKAISYNLNINIPILDKLNKRLSDLLIKSYNIYPRKYLFVGRKNWNSQNLRQIEPSTIATWLRTLLDNKNIGVDGIRSAFASYYIPKLNNAGRKIMAYRMRTSVDMIHRSYFKNVYDTPYNSNKAQIIIKDDLKDDKVLEEKEPTKAIPIKTRKDINKISWNKWYSKDKNKELHRERVKKSNNPLSYAKRMVRELNANKISFNSIKQSTIDKYSIKKNDKNEYYTDLK